MISSSNLDLLMHRAWPGLLNVPIDGWIARMAEGVTQRANSVLPVRCPRDIPAALDTVETLYRERGLAPTFQIGPAAQPADLDDILARRGYERRSPTLVCVARVSSALQALPLSDTHVATCDEPGEEWLRLWHAVDGRGGLDWLPVARNILISCPGVYVSIRDSEGLAAVGRVALIGDWGGIYCMATRVDARRRGRATAVLNALLQEAKKRTIKNTWLQVVEQNHGARALYERAGFATVSGYHYRTLP